jgi:hypothetical protein
MAPVCASRDVNWLCGERKEVDPVCANRDVNRNCILENGGNICNQNVNITLCDVVVSN